MSSNPSIFIFQVIPPYSIPQYSSSTSSYFSPSAFHAVAYTGIASQSTGISPPRTSSPILHHSSSHSSPFIFCFLLSLNLPCSCLDAFCLSEHRNKPSSKLSPGLHRRLLVAVAFLGEPRLVLLDEPTTGVDPEARRAIWEVSHVLYNLGGGKLCFINLMVLL